MNILIFLPKNEKKQDFRQACFLYVLSSDKEIGFRGENSMTFKKLCKILKTHSKWQSDKKYVEFAGLSGDLLKEVIPCKSYDTDIFLSSCVS
jgi:hypothetical protein